MIPYIFAGKSYDIGKAKIKFVPEKPNDREYRHGSSAIFLISSPLESNASTVPEVAYYSGFALADCRLT
jgi:hypothetical protein